MMDRGMMRGSRHDRSRGPRFRPYPEYRDSGVEWLGQIPAEWDLKRLKYLATLNDEALPETTDPGFEMSYVDIGSVDATAGLTETESLIFEKAPSRARRIVRDGDVIVSTVRTYLRAIAAIQAAEPNLIVSTGFAVIRPRQIESAFAAYALRAPHFIERVVANSVGVSYPAINPSRLSCFPIAFPDIEKQRDIAGFLDRETAKIDALLAKKERLIALLREKHTALISRAVTRGLDPNVSMKDSGMGWLGRVPTHWDIVPFKRAIDYVEGPGIMAVDFRLEGVPLLRISGIGGRWATLDGCNYLSPEAVQKRWKHFRVQTGDLLISGSASTGFCTEVNRETAGAIPYTGIIIIRPRAERISKDYVRWMLLSNVFTTQTDLARTGSTIQHFGPSHIAGMRIPIPPRCEQSNIVGHLEVGASRIDALIAKVREAIALLHEYRTALISAAVTGKIDVRQAAA